MKNNLLNQKPRILDQFRQHGKISRNYAIRSMFITRLSSLIHDLRTEGWDIDTKYTTDPNDCIYTLISPPKK